MRKMIAIPKGHELSITELSRAPESISIEVGSDAKALVQEGDLVSVGTPLLEYPNHVDHSSLNGRVINVNGTVVVKAVSEKNADKVTPIKFQQGDISRFLKTIGLVGMGGGRFPASIKSKSSTGAHTLVINAVECEPNVTIDHSLLLHDAELIQLGVKAYAEAIGATKVVLAVRRNRQFVKKLKELYDHRVIQLPNVYPSGAERLILKKLVGSVPPAGILPFELGYLVHNVASLRAVGKAVRDGIPVLERPMTIHAPCHGVHVNVIVPVGMRVADLLEEFGCMPDANEIIVLGGLMMGNAGTLESLVHKGVTAILIQPRRDLVGAERDCISCASCVDVCPIGLHPNLMADAIREDKFKFTVDVSVDECFLCGACSAVCPSNIPLSQLFRDRRLENRS